MNSEGEMGVTNCEEKGPNKATNKRVLNENWLKKWKCSDVSKLKRMIIGWDGGGVETFYKKNPPLPPSKNNINEENEIEKV